MLGGSKSVVTRKRRSDREAKYFLPPLPTIFIDLFFFFLPSSHIPFQTNTNLSRNRGKGPLYPFLLPPFLSHHKPFSQDSPFCLLTMGTEIIRPQNCLVDRLSDSPATLFPHPRRNQFHRRPPLRPGQRRRFGSDEFRTTAKDVVRRRGESFDSISNIKARRSSAKNPPEVYGDDIYAGSSIFVVSPAPSSLPLPSFSRRNAKSQVFVVPVDDSASQNIRRLLRLEF